MEMEKFQVDTKYGNMTLVGSGKTILGVVALLVAGLLAYGQTPVGYVALFLAVAAVLATLIHKQHLLWNAPG